MRFSVGRAWYELGGINENVNAFVQEYGISNRQVNGSKPVATLAMDVGVLIKEWFSAGARFAHHRADYGGNTELPRLGYDIRIYEVLGDLSLTIPSQSGLTLGARAGISLGRVAAWGEVSNTSCSRGTSSIVCNYTVDKHDIKKWSSATGFLEIYSGGQLRLHDKVIPFLRAGYSFRKFSNVGNSPPVLNLDFSGWFVEMGFGGILRAN